MNGDVSFNGYPLQTYFIVTNVIDHTDGPDSVYQLMQVANANRSTIQDIDSPSKIITLAGSIRGTSQVNLAQRIDAFKAYFNGRDKFLDINHGGATRRYIATVPPGNVKVKMRGSVLFANYTVTAICTDAFGMDTSPTQLFAQNGLTLSTFTIPNIPVGGSAPYQLPMFRVTVNARTGSGDYIQFTNNANNQAIIIAGQGIDPGDVIIIDCENRKVTIGGTEVDYTGTFFELEPGNVSITYTDGFTTRNVNLYAEYYKRYQ